MTEPTKLPAEAPRAKIEAGGKIQAIVPRDIEEAFRMAEAIFVSGMYPDSYAADATGKSGRQMGAVDKRATVSRIMIGIQKAMEVGLAPITGLSTIYIVNNRPTIFGDGVPALLYGSGKIVHIKEWFTGVFGQDDYTAHCEVLRKDSSEPIHREFSWADAKKAGLLGKTGPWQTHPKRQLQMRARGFAARDGAADILSGLGIYEEVMDIPEKKVSIDTSSLDDELGPPITATEIMKLNEVRNKEFAALENKRDGELLDAVIQRAQKIIQQNQDNSDAPPATEAATVKESLQVEASEKSPDPKCEKCFDKKSIFFRETDPETGEVTEGIEPCPYCKTQKGN